ncbi:MAG: hypothetical protein ABIS45_15765 [Burkholderiales bacterium]
MKGRRSSHVQLVALGTVLIGACSDQDIPKDRYVYKARPECVQDWGETNCQSASATGSHGGVVGPSGGGGYIFGPRFNQIVETPAGKHVWSGNADRPAVHPLTGDYMGSKSVNISAPRGGFGSSARSFGSIGS